MDDVAEQFLVEGEAMFFGVGESGVGRDADIPGVAEGLVAFEGDDIGGRRVVEVVGVESGQRGIGQEGDRKLARWDCAADLRFGI